MGIALHPRTRQAHAIDQRRMIQRIRENHIVRPGECGDQSKIGQITSAKQQGARQTDKSGERTLQLIVHGKVSGHQMRRTRSRPHGMQATLQGFDDAGIVGQAKVIVAAKRQPVTPLQGDAWRLRSLQLQQPAQTILGLQLLQLCLQPMQAHARNPNRMQFRIALPVRACPSARGRQRPQDYRW